VPNNAASATVPDRARDAAEDRRRKSALATRAQRDRTLFERYRDPLDRIDRDAVVERFLPLARQIAARYQRPEEPSTTSSRSRASAS
jgi:hypothetical protein